MSIKLIVMVKRKEGLSPAAFRDGYENGHARLAVRLFGHLWSEYRRNYLGVGNSFAGFESSIAGSDTGYDAISEIIFPNDAAIAEMQRIATEHYEEIREDEHRWFDRSHCWLVACDTVEEDLTATRALHAKEIQA